MTRCIDTLRVAARALGKRRDILALGLPKLCLADNVHYWVWQDRRKRLEYCVAVDCVNRRVRVSRIRLVSLQEI